MHAENEPFGGFDIFMFGDFRQLPSVGARAMYSRNIKDTSMLRRVFTSTHEKLVEGLNAYYEINQVISLTENMRQRVKVEKGQTRRQARRKARRARNFRRHLDRMGNGTCSGERTDVDKVSGYSDVKWWSKAMLEKEADIEKWMDDDRVVTLVHTNQEALNISAEYAVRKFKDEAAVVWQWPAHNADQRAACADGDVMLCQTTTLAR